MDRKGKGEPSVVMDTGGGRRSATSGEIFLAFDRNTGGLSVTSTDPSYELLVDGRLVGVSAMTLSRITPGRINRIVDSNFDELLPCWRVGGPESSTFAGRNFSPEWTLENGGTAHVASHAGPGEQPVVAHFHCPVEGAAISIAAGETYVFQAYLGQHRAPASLRLVFLDAGGNELDARQTHSEPTHAGGRSLSAYSLKGVIATAPSVATHVRIEIVKGVTLAGSDSFLFFTKPSFIRAAQPVDHGQLMNELPFDLVARFFASGAEALFHDEVPVPDEALDGGWHDVTARNARSGASATVPVAVPQSIHTSVGVFGLEASALVCKFSAPERWRAPIGISLWVDGAPTPGKHYSETGTGNLRIPLPVSACDGLPHVFEIRLGLSGQLLGRHAAMGPLSVTPWDALQKYAGAPLPAHLSPLAGYRYRSLSATGTGPRTPDGPTIRELHDILLLGMEVPRKSFRVLPFPDVEEPDVSIVIPVHNKFDITYVCLAALLFAATKASFEVIVVDDGSSDTTLSLREIAPGITVVRHDKAQGFVAACNAGAKKARGRHIVFLNNDTEPTAHWLDELLFMFETYDNVGLAGAKLIYADGKLQEAGGIVWDSGDPWNYGRGANAHDPRFSYSRQCDYVSAAAVMIDAALWREVGGFSREFMPAYFEDTDLAFKVRAAGRKVVFAPLSIVVHYEGMSNGTEETAATGLKRYQEVNRPKFKRKWAANFEGLGKLGVDADLAKDRGIKKRVLFIDYEIPQLDRDAGSYAALQEIRMFQALGSKVTFLPLNMAYLGRHTEHLQRLGVETIYAPFASSFAAFIQERGAEFDVVYITRYGVASHVLGLIGDHARQARLVINVADLHFLREIRDALHDKNAAKMEGAIKTRDAELSVLSRAELVLSYSHVEQAVITSHITSGPKAGIVPWVVETVPLRKSFKERSGIAFMGGYRHYPNVDAVRFFATEVMPLLRAALPGVPFLVYGSAVPPEIEALAAEDVIIKGFVPDVSDVFDTCRVFVAPLLTGAGMKGKVLDGLAAGIPSVLSPVAAEGIGLRDGSEALIARKPEDWVAAIARLYNDEPAWTAMSRQAHAFAESQYSFAKGVAGLSEALASIDLFMTPGTPALSATSARPVPPTAITSAATGPRVPALTK